MFTFPLMRHQIRRFLSTKFTKISQVLKEKPIDQEVTVQGWVESVQKHKTVTFVQISDRTALFKNLQVVVRKNDGVQFDSGCGAFVQVYGRVAKSRGRKQDLDLVAQQVRVVGPDNGQVFPHRLSSSAHSIRDLVELRQFPHLRPRCEVFRAVLSARSKATSVVHDYFKENNFLLTHPPILTQNHCEDGSEVFRAESDTLRDEESYGGFFGCPAYLTVSTQLHLEALCAGVGNVYTFSPIFRADHSQTRQHLAEFYMIEAEMPFLGDVDDLCNLVEDFIRKFALRFSQEASVELDIVAQANESRFSKDEMRRFIEKPFKRLRYEDVCDILLSSKTNFSVPFKPGNDLTKQQELYVVEQLRAPVFVTHHPAKMKPFYMRTSADNKYALSIDLLFPNVAEVCGGSVREHDLERLESRMAGVAGQKLDWYLDLRRVGTFPHAGFGVGFERLFQFCLGLKNIRDVVAFPRFIGNCKN